MSSDLSPENEQYINSSIARGDFQNRAEVLNLGIGLLKQRQQLLDDIDDGIRQLRSGAFQEYDSAGLQKLMDGIQVAGRARYDARQAGQ